MIGEGHAAGEKSSEPVVLYLHGKTQPVGPGGEDRIAIGGTEVVVYIAGTGGAWEICGRCVFGEDPTENYALVWSASNLVGSGD